MTAKIAITGASGFIGSALCGGLLDAGYEAHAIVRSIEGSERLRGRHPDLFIHTLDSSYQQLNRVLADVKPDAVVHLAALFVPEHRPRDVRPLIESNVLLGAELVESMAGASVGRLLNTGTSWQHFQDQTYLPASLYAATKQAFEAIIKFYVDAYEMSVITLVLSDTYGPNDDRAKLFPALTSAALEGKPLQMSPGEQKLDLVHVDDVVDGYLKALALLLDMPKANERNYQISSGRTVSLRDLVSQYERQLGVRVPVVWGGRTYRAREVMIPWQGGVPIPGWKPKIDLESGLRSLVAAMRAAH
jgi:nucleoside-diphosphate-sugar epimerase